MHRHSKIARATLRRTGVIHDQAPVNGMCRDCIGLAGAGWRTEPHQYLEQTAKAPPSEAAGDKEPTDYRCGTCQSAWQLEAGAGGRGWLPLKDQT